MSEFQVHPRDVRVGDLLHVGGGAKLVIAEAWHSDDSQAAWARPRGWYVILLLSYGSILTVERP